MPIAGVSMAASTVSLGRPTPFTICRLGWTSKCRLFVKPKAAQLLHATFRGPAMNVAPIAMGTNTDPYQPIEERWRVTRSVVELLVETRHPFTITTKSDRVLRDLDLLEPAAELGIVSVALSVTSLDPKIARTLEPRAPTPHRRVAAIKALNEAGVPCYIAIAPVVPQITDHELEAIVEAAAKAGAPGGFYLPVRLPHEVAPLFRAWLDEHFPDRAGKVMATINSMRGGRDNDPNFFSRMQGQGPWADLSAHPFRESVQALRPWPGQIRASPRPIPATAGRPASPALMEC